MTLGSQVRSWVRAMMGRTRFENEMDAELRFHMEAFTEDLQRKGVPREDAMRQARIEFGGVERAKEECRDARGVRFAETLLQDLRYGARAAKEPGLHGDRGAYAGAGNWRKHSDLQCGERNSVASAGLQRRGSPSNNSERREWTDFCGELH